MYEIVLLEAGGYLLKYRDEGGYKIQHNIYCETMEKAVGRLIGLKFQ